jgi:inositol oxygenase
MSVGILQQTNDLVQFGTKVESEFRVFHPNTQVYETYRKHHKNQTLDFVLNINKKHCEKFGKLKMSIWEAIRKTDQIVDESDPDTSFPQIVHSFQTAEGLRAAFPELEWLPLIGLLHDLGKVLALPEFGPEPQWCVVGDTFPVGCRFDPSIVFNELLAENPDSKHPVYSTPNGIYHPGCGLKNLHFTFGHDEYMYQVLKHNESLIPEEGLRIIRFHSFYPWHKEGAYRQFMDEEDKITLRWVQLFSKLDLYSKDALVPDIEKLMPHYTYLVSKYFPNEILDW